MTKTLIIVVMGLGVAGCGPHKVVDQNMRRKYFIECLEKIPKGPTQTKYNDWDEVVGACDNTAYYHAIRVADGTDLILHF